MSITYELALKLKEAGFPQVGRGNFVDSQNEYRDFESGVDDTEIYCPTLSEIIEACGDGTVVSYFKNHSIATNPSKNMFSGIEYSSPEEAVANLCLELNKK